jgi:hypothetical protein
MLVGAARGSTSCTVESENTVGEAAVWARRVAAADNKTRE